MASGSGSGSGRPPRRPLTEEEQKAREQRHRERRERDAKDPKKKSHRHADLIDKLDETNPFGPSMFRKWFNLNSWPDGASI